MWTAMSSPSPSMAKLSRSVTNQVDSPASCIPVRNDLRSSAASEGGAPKINSCGAGASCGGGARAVPHVFPRASLCASRDDGDAAVFSPPPPPRPPRVLRRAWPPQLHRGLRLGTSALFEASRRQLPSLLSSQNAPAQSEQCDRRCRGSRYVCDVSATH